MKTALKTLFISCLLLAGCSSKNDVVFNELQKVENEICEILNSIDSKESAEQAIPRLEELVPEKRELGNQYYAIIKNNPEISVKNSKQVGEILMNFGTAMAKVNTNENIPQEQKQKILDLF